MDRKTNKLPALLFALVMTFSLLSVRAFAAGTSTALITSVSVTIEAPVAGLNPDYDPVLPSDAGCYNDGNVNTGNWRNHVVWKDLSDETSGDNSLDPNHGIFKLGHRYHVIIYLTPRDGYSFSESAAATLNGNAAQTSAASGSRLIVEYTFPALETSWVSSARVTLDAPEAGTRPDYTAAFPSGAQYYSAAHDSTYNLNDILWRDTTEGKYVSTADSVFQAGHEYEVIVYLTPKDGYAFSSGTAATINGKAAQASMSSGRLQVKYYFPALPETISSVSVFISSPVAGLSPDYELLFPSNANYYNENVDTGNYRNYIVWKDLSNETSADNSLDPDSDVFKLGHRYQVIIYLTPRDGYSFSNNVTAKFPPKTAQVTPASNGRIIVEYTFPEVNTSWIPSAYITLDAPMPDARPDYTAVFPSGAQYYSFANNTGNYCNDIIWRDSTDGEDMDKENSVFRAGHEYEVTVYLTANSAYAFASGTAARINGKTAQAKTSYGQLEVKYTFAPLPDLVSSVSVTFDAPVAGLRPDYEPEFPSGAHYYNENVNTGNYRNYIVWKDLSDETSADNSLDPNEPDPDVFKLGHRYRVSIYLTPKDGFTFAESVTARVNGSAVQATPANKGRIIVEYTFPEVNTSWIPSAVITLDAPEAGAHPDYFAAFPSGAGYFLADHSDSDYYNDICWRDSADGTVLSPDTGLFQAGHSYEAVVYLTPKDGHAFSPGSTATVNEKTAQASMVSGKLEVRYIFGALPETISSVSFTIDGPVAGQHPCYEPVFPSDAYYFNDDTVDTGGYRNHIVWKEVDSDGTVGKSLDPDEDVFSLAYRYQVTVYLTARDGCVFSRKSAAKVNGKTAETTAAQNGRLIVTYTFARTEKPTLVVIWKDSDGTELEQDYVYYGATPSYDGVAPTKASTPQYNYVFAGWTPAVTPVTASATYTATYTEYLRSYTVTFNADGGSPEPSDQTVKYGSSAAEPAPPEKTGYVFAGWYNGSKKYDFNAAVTGAVTLKAKWTLRSCSISFEPNGGSGTMAAEKVDHGKSFSLPSCGFTAPAGKQFDRWDIGGTKYDAGDTVTVTSDLTAKATWKDLPPAEYSVTVSSSAGGKATVSVLSAAEGTTVTVKVTPAQGYALSKLTWTAQGGTAKDITSSKEFTMPAGNVTVRAVFKSVAPSVSGSVSGSTLSYATANVPSGAVLIAARYDGGRQTYAAVIAGPGASGSVAMKGKGTAYRLYLAESGTYKPLCEAWSS